MTFRGGAFGRAATKEEETRRKWAELLGVEEDRELLRTLEERRIGVAEQQNVLTERAQDQELRTFIMGLEQDQAQFLSELDIEGFDSETRRLLAQVAARQATTGEDRLELDRELGEAGVEIDWARIGIDEKSVALQAERLGLDREALKLQWERLGLDTWVAERRLSLDAEALVLKQAVDLGHLSVAQDALSLDEQIRTGQLDLDTAIRTGQLDVNVAAQIANALYQSGSLEVSRGQLTVSQDRLALDRELGEAGLEVQRQDLEQRANQFETTYNEGVRRYNQSYDFDMLVHLDTQVNTLARITLDERAVVVTEKGLTLREEELVQAGEQFAAELDFRFSALKQEDNQFLSQEERLLKRLTFDMEDAQGHLAIAQEQVRLAQERVNLTRNEMEQRGDQFDAQLQQQLAIHLDDLALAREHYLLARDGFNLSAQEAANNFYVQLGSLSMREREALLRYDIDIQGLEQDLEKHLDNLGLARERLGVDESQFERTYLANRNDRLFDEEMTLTQFHEGKDRFEKTFALDSRRVDLVEQQHYDDLALRYQTLEDADRHHLDQIVLGWANFNELQRQFVLEMAHKGKALDSQEKLRYHELDQNMVQFIADIELQYKRLGVNATAILGDLAIQWDKHGWQQSVYEDEVAREEARTVLTNLQGMLTTFEAGERGLSISDRTRIVDWKAGNDVELREEWHEYLRGIQGRWDRGETARVETAETGVELATAETRLAENRADLSEALLDLEVDTATQQLENLKQEYEIADATTQLGILATATDAMQVAVGSGSEELVRSMFPIWAEMSGYSPEQSELLMEGYLSAAAKVAEQQQAELDLLSVERQGKISEIWQNEELFPLRKATYGLDLEQSAINIKNSILSGKVTELEAVSTVMGGMPAVAAREFLSELGYSGEELEEMVAQSNETYQRGVEAESLGLVADREEVYRMQQTTDLYIRQMAATTELTETQAKFEAETSLTRQAILDGELDTLNARLAMMEVEKLNIEANTDLTIARKTELLNEVGYRSWSALQEIVDAGNTEAFDRFADQYIKTAGITDPEEVAKLKTSLLGDVKKASQDKQLERSTAYVDFQYRAALRNQVKIENSFRAEYNPEVLRELRIRNDSADLELAIDLMLTGNGTGPVDFITGPVKPIIYEAAEKALDFTVDDMIALHSEGQFDLAKASEFHAKAMAYNRFISEQFNVILHPEDLGLVRPTDPRELTNPDNPWVMYQDVLLRGNVGFAPVVANVSDVASVIIHDAIQDVSIPLALGDLEDIDTDEVVRIYDYLVAHEDVGVDNLRAMGIYQASDLMGEIRSQYGEIDSHVIESANYGIEEVWEVFGDNPEYAEVLTNLPKSLNQIEHSGQVDVYIDLLMTRLEDAKLLKESILQSAAGNLDSVDYWPSNISDRRELINEIKTYGLRSPFGVSAKKVLTTIDRYTIEVSAAMSNLVSVESDKGW